MQKIKPQVHINRKQPSFSGFTHGVSKRQLFRDALLRLENPVHADIYGLTKANIKEGLSQQLNHFQKLKEMFEHDNMIDVGIEKPNIEHYVTVSDLEEGTAQKVNLGLSNFYKVTINPNKEFCKQYGNENFSSYLDDCKLFLPGESKSGILGQITTLASYLRALMKHELEPKRLPKAQRTKMEIKLHKQANKHAQKQMDKKLK